MCGQCWKKLHESSNENNAKCPICRVILPIFEIRNRSLEQIVREIPAICELGECKQEMPYGELITKHVDHCKWQPIKCKYQELGCNWKGLRKDVNNHVHDIDKEQILELLHELKKDNENVKQQNQDKQRQITEYKHLSNNYEPLINMLTNQVVIFEMWKFTLYSNSGITAFKKIFITEHIFLHLQIELVMHDSEDDDVKSWIAMWCDMKFDFNRKRYSRLECIIGFLPGHSHEAVHKTCIYMLPIDFCAVHVYAVRYHYTFQVRIQKMLNLGAPAV